MFKVSNHWHSLKKQRLTSPHTECCPMPSSVQRVALHVHVMWIQKLLCKANHTIKTTLLLGHFLSSVSLNTFTYHTHWKTFQIKIVNLNYTWICHVLFFLQRAIYNLDIIICRPTLHQILLWLSHRKETYGHPRGAGNGFKVLIEKAKCKRQTPYTKC
jgi:hypothetical protein